MLCMICLKSIFVSISRKNLQKTQKMTRFTPHHPTENEVLSNFIKISSNSPQRAPGVNFFKGYLEYFDDTKHKHCMSYKYEDQLLNTEY